MHVRLWEQPIEAAFLLVCPSWSGRGLTGTLSCPAALHSPDKIHSGESDFDPPRFKPDPAVYLLAAESEVRQQPLADSGELVIARCHFPIVLA